jgi:hypothetical protein
MYKIKEIKPGNVFGHDEMILGLRRRCRVKALMMSNVIYLNKADYTLAFPRSVKAEMKAEAKDMDLIKIMEKINKYNKEKRI